MSAAAPPAPSTTTATATATATVVVVEACSAQRRRLRAEVEAEHDLTVVGEARSGAEAVALVARLRPSAVLLRLDLPEQDGSRPSSAS